MNGINTNSNKDKISSPINNINNTMVMSSNLIWWLLHLPKLQNRYPMHLHPKSTLARMSSPIMKKQKRQWKLLLQNLLEVEVMLNTTLIINNLNINNTRQTF